MDRVSCRGLVAATSQQQQLNCLHVLCHIDAEGRRNDRRVRESQQTHRLIFVDALVASNQMYRLKMEAYLEDWVRNMPQVRAAAAADHLTLGERVEGGFAAVREIVGNVWPYILGGIAIGAGIHGYVPQDFMASFMGKGQWWSVPAGRCHRRADV